MTEMGNVQIPLTLFRKILVLFEHLSLSSYILPALYDFDNILSDLRSKQHKINMRAAYTNTVYAKSDEQRQIARSNYQKLKKGR